MWQYGMGWDRKWESGRTICNNLFLNLFYLYNKDCKGCKLKHTFEIQHNQCIFLDRQVIRFQEMPENIPDGESPQTVNVIAYEAGVDSVRPGDRVEVIGIYRA